MQLFVRLPSNGTQVICVYRYNTIKDVKNMLGLVGCNLYTNKLLEDQHTIEHYALPNNSTVYALGRGVGGIPTAETVGGPSLIVQAATSIAKFIKDIGDVISERMLKVSEMVSSSVRFVKSMVTITKFFPIITIILIILAVFGKPLEIIMLIIGLLCVAALYVIYSIMNLPPFIYVWAFFWFSITQIVPFIAYCIILGALLLVIFLICLILTAINAASGGALNNLVLCENSPGAWYKTANYHLGNKYERGLLCSRPCLSKYAPDSTGMTCIRNPPNTPPYCPQAEIMRIYANKTADKNYMYKPFGDNNIKYLSSPPEKREKMLADYYIGKAHFIEKCNKEMGQFDPITLNICASANNLGLNDKELIKLKQVCAQAYCTADKNYPFCSKISSLKENDENAVIKQIVKITIFVMVFTIILLFAFKYIYSTKQI